jgi:hypothetical protein
MLKRTGWTNDEVIKILEGRKIYVKEGEGVAAWIKEHNDTIDQCIYQFWDFKAEPDDSFSAMAYETDNGQIYVISEPMPQTEEEHQAYLKKFQPK